MSHPPIVIPVGPKAIRVFAGYRLPALDRQRFYKELAETFMPGTPYMLAPLGLNAYLAAVPDLDPALGLPDEVALIVYRSPEEYTSSRQQTLPGRMYTHSHAGVFNLESSRGQFPGTEDAPSHLAAPDGDRWAWHLTDTEVDWQQDSTRLLFLGKANESAPALQPAVQAAVRAQRSSLAGAGVAQGIVLAAPAYAAIWLHGPGASAVAPDALVPTGARLMQDLLAAPVAMKTGVEGPAITGAGAFTFRFARELKFFL